MSAAQALAGPPSSVALMSPLDIEAEFRRSADRTRRKLADGSLHGHRITERKGGRWDIPRAVVLAWLGGRTPTEQRAVCPLCPAPAPTPLRRAGRRP